MSRFWPPADPPQQVYERLRSDVRASGRLPDELAAARFARRGLAGLIIWPDAEPVFSVRMGAPRAAWTPYADPRALVLAATYRLLLDNTGQAHTGRCDQPYPDALIASGQHR
jgi:hypothetical protein